MANLFDPPDSVTLPLIKGEDVDVEITYTVLLVDAGGLPVLDPSGQRQYVVTDFPAGATVQLIIEPNITGDALITGSTARMQIDNTLVNGVRNGTLWRIVMTEVNDVDKVILHGKTRRFDG